MVTVGHQAEVLAPTMGPVSGVMVNMVMYQVFHVMLSSQPAPGRPPTQDKREREKENRKILECMYLSVSGITYIEWKKPLINFGRQTIRGMNQFWDRLILGLH